jgi:hypothetical protein
LATGAAKTGAFLGKSAADAAKVLAAIITATKINRFIKSPKPRA